MITTTALEMRILAMVEPSLEAMGYRVVQLRLMDGKHHKTLLCLMERSDDVSMTVNDCEKISHTISALLDVEDPISVAYHLEVSSAGLERPLTRMEDFTRFTGYVAQVEMIMPMEGRKRFRGVIQNIKDGVIVLDCDGKPAVLPFAQVKQAKLVATEALIKSLLAAEHGTQKKMRKAKRTEKTQKKDHKKRKTTI